MAVNRAADPEAETPIHIAAACNDAFAMPLAVMLVSLAANLRPGTRVTAFIVQGGLGLETRSKIERSLQGSAVELVWLGVERRRLAHFQNSLRSYYWFTTEAFFRLLLPELLHANIEKVIYLDCDLVINADIGNLWDLDPAEDYLLAVGEIDPDTLDVGSKNGVHFYQELGLPPEQSVFNSGVLLINLRAWRERCLARRVFDYSRAAQEDLQWADQEGLNAMTEGAWREIDPRWNVTTHHFRGRSPSSSTGAAILREPFIVHYTGALKPWHAHYKYGFKDLFLAHLDRTAWAGWRPESPRVGDLSRPIAIVVKAARKRIHRLKQRLRPLQHLLRTQYVLRKPVKLLGDRALAARGRDQLRVVIIAQHAAQVRPEAIDEHLDNGAERILIVLRRGAPELTPLMSRSSAVHLIDAAHDRRSDAEILRHLLHRFGRGHWCLVLGPGDRFIWPAHCGRRVRDLCAYLDATGFDALRCTIGCGRSSPGREMLASGLRDAEGRSPGSICSVNSVARDEMTGRVFAARFDVDRRARAEEDEVLSRIALMRYHEKRAMAPDLRAIEGSREADCRGVILTSGDESGRWPLPREA